jgi:hypothetical protein
MILIAALGVATWGLRGLWMGIVEDRAWTAWSLTSWRLVIATVLAAVATPLTVACLVFRLRRPRPPRRRLWIQPGAAAVLACTLVFAVRAVEAAAALAWPSRYGFGSVMLNTITTIRFNDAGYLAYVGNRDANGVIGFIEAIACHSTLVASFTAPAGLAVAVAWTVLAVSGRWRPERSWIDRLGRGLGAIWILITALTLVPAHL